MSFELYVNWVGRSEQVGISRAEIRSLFPVVEEASEPDYWRVRYDEKSICHVGVVPLKTDATMLASLYVDRPCAEPKLWDALVSALRIGSAVLFWPGGPPVVASAEVIKDLPNDMIDALGQPRVVESGKDLVQLVEQS